ncbi:MAG: hypothetical protein ACYS18_12930 [Planctomycetota bacterium]|jgi:ribosomal protein RSM22 (predicted rRNA methylase)
MNRTLQTLVLKELCPDGIWQLNSVMKSVLKRQISQLPKKKVLDIEIRRPQNPALMRAFLVKFFTRHYFQVQNSLLEYMTSQDFLDIVRSGHLRILDVGCGPAVASLAITNMLAHILKHLEDMGKWPKGKTVRITYVLNDSSDICLAVGQQMLTNYFRTGRQYDLRPIHNITLAIEKAFPKNMGQLKRISCNLGQYDIANFCYVVESQKERASFQGLINGLLETEKLCNPVGKILIIIDRFNMVFTRRLARAMKISSQKQTLTQYVYPKRNANVTFTYRYYRCLYSPSNTLVIKHGVVA